MKTKDQNEVLKTEAAYPVYDLSEAVKVAEAVRDLGGNNAPVSRSLLAQHLKYAETGPSFFQRVAASKSFGVIDGRGSYSLTELAKQYFYPTVENGKESAAVKMLTFPKSFGLLVQKFDGGKLPGNEMIGNIIHAEADIPVSKKNILAGCFVRSAQFIGAIDTGGFLRCKALVSAGKKVLDGIASGKIPNEFNLDDAPADLKPNDQTSKPDQHTLYLSPDKKRMVTLAAPLAISSAEYTRICNWIKVTLIVSDGVTELLADPKSNE
ncbi:MAG: hypothetical protein ABSA45_00625 [Verrucomicrobiota bacterium]|jgi:hypothetical protein